MIDDEIKAGIRQLIAKKGQKVVFDERYSYRAVSCYGWTVYDAWEHFLDGCSWVIPQGIVVTEETYSMFAGTFTGNDDEVGLNAPGCRCKCGKYTDVTLRVTCSLGEAIRELIGYDSTKRLEL